MTTSELRADVHSTEPIPDADRDSTGPQQMWIWAGANIAPVNWALGALGIILKLGLWETISVCGIQGWVHVCEPVMGLLSNEPTRRFGRQ
jgi:purine-cytosine permease-like protein